MNGIGSSAMVGLAFGAGLLAPVNPCGIALLPAYLAAFLPTSDGDAPAAGPRAALKAGVGVTAGFIAITALVGVVVTAGLRGLVAVLPWVEVVLGPVLVVLGILTLFGRRLRFGRLAPPGGMRPAGRWRLVALGGGYALASASCTLSILLAAVSQALMASTPGGVAAVLGAYLAGATLVLLALTVAAVLANAALRSCLGNLARYLPTVSGALLVLSGLYLAVVVTGPDWISAHPTAVVLTAGLLALVTAALVRRSGPATPAGVPADAGCECAPTPSATNQGVEG